MSEELRNSLWNVLQFRVWGRRGFVGGAYHEIPEIHAFSRLLWFNYFKKPIDTRPSQPVKVLAEIRSYFFSAEWFEVYDFMEWTLAYVNDANSFYRDRESIFAEVNLVLENELAGFRFVGGMFTDITSSEEVALIEEALTDDGFTPVRAHLTAALRLLSDRKAPDYRNSIKESISAVESLAQVISGNPKATLADALAGLERNGRLHNALKRGFCAIYGYTSDEGGIRHAMLEEPELTAADAKFFLLSCTSFINYLKSRI